MDISFYMHTMHKNKPEVYFLLTTKRNGNTFFTLENFKNIAILFHTWFSLRRKKNILFFFILFWNRNQKSVDSFLKNLCD